MGNELTYVLIALLSAFGLLLIDFVLLYLKSLKVQSGLREENDSLKHQKEDLEKGTYAPANDQARQIIEAANKKAAEIIANVQGISEQEKQILNNSFQQMLAANLKDYRSVAGKFSQTYDSFIGGVGKDVKARLDMGLNKIIADAQLETKKTSSVVNSSLQSLYRGYETEVSEFKKRILSQIDSLGVDFIKHVSLKVLGKTLSKKEQEDMIIQSLEEAKKLGFFK